MAVILSGDKMVQRAATLKDGQRIRVEGFMARAGYRGEARDRLILHARQLDSLD